jgi:diguanylate cyclase (GGDEF)-like protein/PAS domain S-box-containing protein
MPHAVSAEVLNTVERKNVFELLETLPQSALLLDRDGVVVFCNAAAADLQEMPRAKVIGRHLDLITDDQRTRGDHDAIWASLLDGKRWSGEVWVRRQQSEPIPLLVTRCPVTDDSGAVVGVLSLGVDRSAEVEAQRFRALVHNSNDIAIIMDASGKITYVSPSVETVAGHKPADMLGTNAWDYHYPDDVEADRADVGAALARGETITREWRLRRADGSWGWFEFTMRDLRDNPAINGVVGNFQDVTQRHDGDAALRESEQIFRRTVEQSSDAFIAVGADDRITEWNPAATRMFGHSAEAAIGSTLAETILPERWHRPYGRGFKQAMSGESRRFLESPFEMIGVDMSGHEFPVEVCVVQVSLGGRSQFQAFVRDISERKATEARLAERALTDELTNLPNRALLRDRLARAVARLARTGSTMSVMFLDVDRFKLVNDGLGHEAGDEVLVQLGTRIQNAIRASDTVARYGGDEFVVIAEDIGSPREPILIAERIMAAVSAPITIGDRKLTPSISVGIAITTKETTPDDLVRNADVAMYRAKERGGGCAVVFDDAMGRRALGRFELEGDLRQAIDDGQLRVHYQPIVSLKGDIIGLEALVRWQHPSRGLLPPGEFIPLAEETSLILPLGLHVLGEAVRQVAAWRARLAPDLQLAVNISARQLVDTSFPGAVADILAAHDFTPSALCLEITETSLMSEPAAAAATLRELRKLGVLVGVDDFGTGYSSLLYLRRFPVQVLKLDRFFVAGMATSHEDAVIAESVITLARSLGMTAIAEGVETREQRDMLEGLGCERAQGFLWSAAGTVEQVESWLADMPARLEADGGPEARP